MAINNQAEFYLNFQQFGDLKLRARENSDDAASAVARQFEGLFVQQMLAAMRSASNIDQDQHSSYMNFYQEMYDKQLAQTIAGQDRLGVAKMIMQQIPRDEHASTDTDAVAALEVPPMKTVTAAPTSVYATTTTTMSAEEKPQPAAVAGVLLGKVVDDDFAEVAQIERANNRWQQPQDFIADIWPQAQGAAQQLGVSAELLVAQSALETGWGQHTMKFDDGRNSNNLFGIKAGANWQGPVLSRVSLEYRGGALQSEVSKFRAYASPADSLADYVDFIRSNPRYQQALSNSNNDQAYIRAIQDAGYATDPQYADKVIGILRGERLQQTLAGINSGVSSYG
ncbi:MAG: flagellar assembly peptidoglycan hydrolase FlgJ [Gammaproteobacteria bacterium]|nr:flagellar assembly peptidoglycan hydrolase FlgJ [Gammaproteobacteria bacterium]